MSFIEKYQTLIILLAVVVGLLLGQLEVITYFSQHLIVPALFLLFYGMFLSISLSDVRQGFTNSKFVKVSLAINFLWTPLLAWLLGAMFLSDHPYLWLGFIMLMVTPCTDWYVIFTGIAKGNVNQSLAILPINFILQLILLPVYLYIFTGVMGGIVYTDLIKSIVIVLLIPLLSANITRKLLHAKNKSDILEDKLIPFFSKTNIIFLSLAIAAMFASQGYQLLENVEILLLMIIPILLFFIINFTIGQFVGRAMYLARADIVSLNFTTLARNSPVALGIAVVAFPDQPLVALALIIGPLLELPILAVIAKVLLLMNNSKKQDLAADNKKD
ncbi:arsenic resistance protein [Desulfuribacillus alkaliarsenatis]|uniref:Arsenic resistance protein n=1 Tax=Desulfuribacillus alkaliarsenatis TaxID=766136 RepID=A0A1E5G0S8_9FIRM|nr:bile acid:sodium symporter [Desulfuribacillus alkaliarsenatis]OEF96353.1 arsenic resistance protein [Desulfuribacillus alkaliarsenatis]